MCALRRISDPLPVDPTRKSLEQLRENPPRAFVRQPELPIESLVRRGHQELGGRQGASVHVAEELPEMQLSPRGADLGSAMPPSRRPASPLALQCRGDASPNRSRS